MAPLEDVQRQADNNGRRTNRFRRQDKITRNIIDRLNRTFVTPLDREDIHALAGSLDDVMDAIDAAAAVVRLYKIQNVRAGARRL